MRVYTCVQCALGDCRGDRCAAFYWGHRRGWCLTGCVCETKCPGCWGWQRKTWGSASSPTPSSCSQHRGAPMLRMPVTTFVGIAGACAWTVAPYICIAILQPPDWGCAVAIHLGARHSVARAPCGIYVSFDVNSCEHFGVLLWHMGAGCRGCLAAERPAVISNMSSGFFDWCHNVRSTRGVLLN